MLWPSAHSKLCHFTHDNVISLSQDRIKSSPVSESEMAWDMGTVSNFTSAYIALEEDFWGHRAFIKVKEHKRDEGL